MKKREDTAPFGLALVTAHSEAREAADAVPENLVHRPQAIPPEPPVRKPLRDSVWDVPVVTGPNFNLHDPVFESCPSPFGREREGADVLAPYRVWNRIWRRVATLWRGREVPTF